MQVDLSGIGRPQPYADKARKLPEKAIKKVAVSIKEFGFRSPIVVDEQEIILAGHTRLEAAKSLGLKKVPVHIATGLTEAQRRDYRIARNRLAQRPTGRGTRLQMPTRASLFLSTRCLCGW